MKTKEECKAKVQPMTAEQAVAVVREYFGDVKVKVGAYWSLGALKITVEYEDFKLPRTVRNDLERLIPYSTVEAVRDFSRNTIFKVLEESYQNDYEMEVVHDGKVLRMSILQIVYCFLYGKDLSAVKDFGELF